MKKASIAVLSAVLFASPAFAEHDGDHHGGKHKGHFIKKIDTNGDGNISRQESQDAASKRFDKVDADKDGQITPAEREEAHKKWEAKRAEWKAKKEQKSAE